MSVSYSKYSKRIKIDDEFSSPNTSDNDDICSDDSYSSECETEMKYTFSCYDQLEAEWMNSADEIKEVRIYVSDQILDWIVEYINTNILNVTIRATVEEVYHHNLDGDVYLVKFYQHESQSSTLSLRRAIEMVKRQLQYKMPWKQRPTYFVRKDSKFADRNVRIRKELENQNSLDDIETTTLDVIWFQIPTIVIYNFSEYLTQNEQNQIDLIFVRESESTSPIFICHQFEWHQHEYIEIDTLCMDICAGEWRHNNLLKDFGIKDILSLDLANKDYRDQYFNDYLDRYLDILLKTLLPQLDADHHEKFEFPVYRLPFELEVYFVSRFYNKMCVSEDKLAYYCGIASDYDLSIVKSRDKQLYLHGNEPTPDMLLKYKDHIVYYNISNYAFFSDSLLLSLLNNSYTELQTYKIRFDHEFNFKKDCEQNMTDYPTIDCNRTFGTKVIIFELENCIESNAVKLASFVKYLINCLGQTQTFNNTEISISFTNCWLDDYSFLTNISEAIQYVRFRDMNFACVQLKVIGLTLAAQKKVIFVNCGDITDHGVMTLLENIEFKRLCIEGTNSFTPLLFYMMAEHLMNKEGVKKIQANRFYENMEDCNQNFEFDYNLVYFSKEGDKIVARNCNSRKIVNLNCLTSAVCEDKSFKTSCNVYKEWT